MNVYNFFLIFPKSSQKLIHLIQIVYDQREISLLKIFFIDPNDQKMRLQWIKVIIKSVQYITVKQIYEFFLYHLKLWNISFIPGIVNDLFVNLNFFAVFVNVWSICWHDHNILFHVFLIVSVTFLLFYMLEFFWHLLYINMQSHPKI